MLKVKDSLCHKNRYLSLIYFSDKEGSIGDNNIKKLFSFRYKLKNLLFVPS